MLRLAFVASVFASGLAVASGCSSSQLGGAGTGGSGGTSSGTGGINTRAEGGSSGGTGGSAAGSAAGTTSTDAGRDAPGEAGRTCRPAAPCPSGWYLNADHVCGPPRPDGGSPCSPVGDGLCYQRCISTADCTDPHTPNCTTIYMFNGSDVGQPLTVCTSTPPLPACTAQDGG